MKKNKIKIYQARDGGIGLSVDVKRETIWASLQQIADLFNVDKSGASRHIKNIFKDLELEENSTVAKIATVQKEGSREVVRDIDYYNLDMILSVGYRVNSKEATKFRRWASKILKDYLTQGFVINKKQIAHNYGNFLEAVKSIKKLSKGNNLVGSSEALNLVEAFANTCALLDAYYKSETYAFGKFLCQSLRFFLVAPFSAPRKNTQPFLELYSNA